MSTLKRGDPWFSDGNLILASDDNTAFKVHRGILASHSEIFQGMFDIPHPELLSESEIFEGCPIVTMYDKGIELANLVKALYDGARFDARNPNDFFYIASILRLSTKYFINHLRVQAIRHLTATWSYTLAGHDNMLELALSSPILQNRTYPYIHPLTVLNLARETHVQIVTPSALYFLSIYPLAEILRGDHPKLSISHPSLPASTFTSMEDVQLYTLMFQHRISLILKFVRVFCEERRASARCEFGGNGLCNRGLLRLASCVSRSWVEKTGPLHYASQAAREVKSEKSICEVCRTEFDNDVTAWREQAWKELPAVVGLSSWEDMEKDELE